MKKSKGYDFSSLSSDVALLSDNSPATFKGEISNNNKCPAPPPLKKLIASCAFPIEPSMWTSVASAE